MYIFNLKNRYANMYMCVVSFLFFRYLLEEPSGYRESTLIIKNMTIQDRDWYYCMSDQHFFQIEAIVLKSKCSSLITFPSHFENNEKRLKLLLIYRYPVKKSPDIKSLDIKSRFWQHRT